MKHLNACFLIGSLSGIAIGLGGCASSEDASELEQEGTIAGRWQLPSAVHEVAQTQFVVNDAPPPWDGGVHCSGTFFSGTQKLKSYLLSAFPGISSIGGYSCRPNTGNTSQTSVHGTGRALDVMIPTIGGDADNTTGDRIGNFLITHAVEFGIQLVIWDQSSWQANRSGEKLRSYGGPIPHIDHLHVELNKAAAEREETPFFRNGIIRIAAGDFNGDGHADLVGRKAADGALLYYANSGSPSAPFANGAVIGAGWSDFDRVIAADLNGDGYSDLVASRRDGTLWYYVNSRIPNAMFSTGALIGVGWAEFTSVIAGDLDGDGFDDLVASRPDGSLWYYANSRLPNAPFGGGALIGSGFTIFNRLVAADITGDGFMDIVATKPDGTLWYYTNSRNPRAPFSTGALIGVGWAEFTSLNAGDLGADGFSDLVVTRADGSLLYYANGRNPSGPFSSGALIGAGWTTFQR